MSGVAVMLLSFRFAFPFCPSGLPFRFGWGHANADMAIVHAGWSQIMQIRSIVISQGGVLSGNVKAAAPVKGLVCYMLSFSGW